MLCLFHSIPSVFISCRMPGTVSPAFRLVAKKSDQSLVQWAASGASFQAALVPEMSECHSLLVRRSKDEEPSDCEADLLSL